MEIPFKLSIQIHISSLSIFFLACSSAFYYFHLQYIRAIGGFSSSQSLLKFLLMVRIMSISSLLLVDVQMPNQPIIMPMNSAEEKTQTNEFQTEKGKLGH